MKTTPILYSAPMVVALQNDTKTQTRRLNGLKKINENPNGWAAGAFIEVSGGSGKNAVYAFFEKDGVRERIRCPYGAPGDVLWVRETFFAFGWWVTEGLKRRFVDFTPEDKDGRYYYEDKPMFESVFKRSDKKMGWYKRPGIFMPKTACRLFLKIKSIRIERLQDITEADAVAEGVLRQYEVDGEFRYKHYLPQFPGRVVSTAKASYKTLWQSLNGPESWDLNPWVWVVEFEKCDKPENF